MLSLFVVMLFLFGTVLLRVLYLSQGSLAQASEQQASMTLTVGQSRGTIYDTKLRPLVNTGFEYRASVAPYPETLSVLSENLSGAALTSLLSRLQDGKPVVTSIDQLLPLAEGLQMVQVPVRYSGALLAPHVIGYVDSTGAEGVTGIEYAYNELLESYAGKATVTYGVDAMGLPMQGIPAEVSNTIDNSQGGVVLTIDKDIQKIAEDAARAGMTRGAVVVMEPDTGRILAMVSMPDYQPDTLADSLNDPGAPLLNRAITNYNCGSVFKLVTTAAALEKGIPTDTTFYCNGQVTIGDMSFHCYNLWGHGHLNLSQALAKSCNPYFMQLVQQLGGDAIYDMAVELGFDRPLVLAENYKTARALLPDRDELQTAGPLANLSIGQGGLMATPVHIAQLVATVVNGGEVIAPTLLKGTVDAAGQFTEASVSLPQRVFSEKTASLIREMMLGVVTDEGTSPDAQPFPEGAGGKSGTAETGWVEDGIEVVQSWFAGYYPANDPKYVVTVLVENRDARGEKSAPIFQKICEELYLLDAANAAG